MGVTTYIINIYESSNILIIGDLVAYAVTSKVKDLIKQHEMNTSGDFMTALDKHIEELVAKAAERAKSNARKTVRGSDL